MELEFRMLTTRVDLNSGRVKIRATAGIEELVLASVVAAVATRVAD